MLPRVRGKTARKKFVDFGGVLNCVESQRQCRRSIGCRIACVSSRRVLSRWSTSGRGGRGAAGDAVMTWEDYVHLAFDEIRMAGARSPQVARRLRAALEDLPTIAPQERKRPLQVQLDLLQSGAQDALIEPSDRIYSSRGDRSGIG